MDFVYSPPIELIFGLGAVVLLILILAICVFISHKKQVKYIYDHKKKLGSKSIAQGISDLIEEKDQVKIRIDTGSEVYRELSLMLKETTVEVSKIDAGLTPPVFGVHDSEQLKASINKIRDQQLVCISQNNATNAASQWSWFGSKSKGKEMVDGYRSLLLEAFNAEFEVIRKQMRFSTLDSAQSKLFRLYEQLDKLGETASVSISDEYLDLKGTELLIWHSELDRLERLKDEKKIQKELLRKQAKLNASDTEELNEEIGACDSDLYKARARAIELSGVEREKINLEIQSIEEMKAKLREKFERSKSQAQLTRAGYVYVISNLGSFGENIVKIGMTRRLEPMDRVNELGDASVPFKFDVHTMAFCEDAPELEKKLHTKFSDYRVNTENHRKEFFRVNPIDVQGAMSELNVESDWYFSSEAKEFFESQVISHASKLSALCGSTKLPNSI
mgnify:CR=1 FL=1